VYGRILTPRPEARRITQMVHNELRNVAAQALRNLPLSNDLAEKVESVDCGRKAGVGNGLDDDLFELLRRKPDVEPGTEVNSQLRLTPTHRRQDRDSRQFAVA